MKSTQEKLDELQAKYEKERAEILRRERIMNVLEPHLQGYHEPSIHFYKLYGAVGTIHVHGTEYSTIREGKQPDAQLLATLLRAYPPVQAIKVTDGCTSFQPDILENNAKVERTRERGGRVDVYDCYGVHVTIELYQHTVADFCWWFEIDGELWQLSVRFQLYQTDLGIPTIRMSGNMQRGSMYDVCEFRPYHGAQRVKWASGGEQYPNRFTLYWDRDSGSKINWSLLARKEMESK